MRVLQTAISLANGGRSVAIRTLVEGLQGLGVSNDLCCLDELGCDEATCAELFGSRIELRRRRLFEWRPVGEMIRFCDDHRIQVIHAHCVASLSIGFLVRLARPRIKLVMTFHRSLNHDTVSFRDRLRNSLAAAWCQAVVACSRERRNYFASRRYISGWKVILIPLGIDVDRFQRNVVARSAIRQQLGVDDDTLLLGACGHFGAEKGIDVVLHAFRELLSRFPGTAKVKLIVLGTGRPDRQKDIESLAAQLPFGSVTLAGFRADRENWFSAMDIFVHGPRLEAFGLVLPEAMAAGLPVVATRVGGITDIVRVGVTGLLVASEDVVGIADAVHMLWSDSELRRRMSINAREIAKHEYSIELCARRYLDLYNDVLAGRRPQGVRDTSPVGYHKATNQTAGVLLSKGNEHIRSSDASFF